MRNYSILSVLLGDAAISAFTAEFGISTVVNFCSIKVKDIRGLFLESYGNMYISIASRFSCYMVEDNCISYWRSNTLYNTTNLIGKLSLKYY